MVVRTRRLIIQDSRLPRWLAFRSNRAAVKDRSCKWWLYEGTFPTWLLRRTGARKNTHGLSGGGAAPARGMIRVFRARVADLAIRSGRTTPVAWNVRNARRVEDMDLACSAALPGMNFPGNGYSSEDHGQQTDCWSTNNQTASWSLLGGFRNHLIGVFCVLACRDADDDAAVQQWLPRMVGKQRESLSKRSCLLPW